MMHWTYSLSLMIGMILVPMALRIPVAFAFLLANIIGVLVFMGGHYGLIQLAANTAEAVASNSLVPIPLFLLMGELFFHTGIAQRVFLVVDALMGGVRGRLSYVTIAGGTLFSALSGSSMGNIAMLSSTMYPEMRDKGYSDKLSMGPIIATGGLAAIIPPSGLAVVLGSLAQMDIGRLLLAGIVPGLLLAGCYAMLVFTITRLYPDSAPSYVPPPVPIGEKVRMVVVNLVPMAFVIFMVIGLIILGIATPTESAAFGVVSVMAVAAMFRALSFGAIISAAKAAMRTTGMIFMIILASTTFSQLLSISGAARGLIGWVQDADASLNVILLSMGLILLVLGAFLEPVGIMMLTVNIFVPVGVAYGLDPIWLGIFILIFIELGTATPPFGMGLFVMLGVTKDKSILDVSLAVAPYIACSFLLVLLIIAVPQIVLFLPSLIGR